jgi:hypothetical protein
MTAAHLIEAANWTTWFGGAYRPWFLNSGQAAAFTIGTLFLVSLIAGWFQLSGLLIGAGAILTMIAILFLGDDGPGTLFPSVVFAGALFIAGATWLGGWMGAEIGRWVYSRR